MYNENFLEKTQKDNNNFKNVFDNLEVYIQVNECEYVYVDEIDLKYVASPLLKNKIVITRKINDFYMFENNSITTKPNMTKLEYKHIVDILILNNLKNMPINEIKELTDEDTILIINLGHNIIYIEDRRKHLKIIITEYEKIVLSQNGMNTQLKYYEVIN